MYEEDQQPRKGLVRNAARQLLKEAKIETFPIPIITVARVIPNLYIDAKVLEDGISGMYAEFNGMKYIRINLTHSKNRNRFTIAHELGHAILGHTNECNRNDSTSINEKEANQFAAELLMPLTLIKNACKTNRTVPKLALAFDVSEEAMQIRVMETGVFKSLNTWN